jgi:hypothetical protein
MQLEGLDEYGSDSGQFLAQELSPASRTQCPNMGNEILIPMQQFRIPKTNTLVRKKMDGQSDLDYREGA